MEEGKSKEYEIDLQNDSVIHELGFLPASEAGDQISKKLNDWTSRYHDIKNSKAEGHEVGS